MQYLRMCRNRHIVVRGHRSISSIVLNPVFNYSIHSRCATAMESPSRWPGSCLENLLHISISQETLVCPNPNCQLKQYERTSSRCRRCRNPLGYTYFEIYLLRSLSSSTSQRVVAIRKEIGTIVRRLRVRRGITQAELASITGVNRTYLSRTERGQVTPSVFAQIQIASALGVDKILVRVRSSSS